MSANSLHFPCPRCRAALVAPVSLAGQEILCNQCQARVSAPHHTAPASASDDLVEPPPIEGEEPGHSWLLMGLIFLVLLASFVLGALGMVLVASWVFTVPTAAEPVDDGDGDSTGMLAPADRWTDASQRSVAFRGAVVSVESVILGPVRFQTAGENRVTDESFLLVNLSVRNASEAELMYKSWYSYRFASSGEELQARCSDDAGTAMLLYPIPGADRVEAHFRSDVYIDPNNSIGDSLIFRLPPGYTLEEAQGLKLALPAAAVGHDGHFRFLIPPAMIERGSPL